MVIVVDASLRTSQSGDTSFTRSRLLTTRKDNNSRGVLMLPRLFVIALALLAPPFVAAAYADCLPSGGSTNLSGTKPGLPNGHSSWSGAPPQMVEDDGGNGLTGGLGGFGDDAMGAATPSGDGSSASGTVTNTDGDLSGPNGADQNGFGEGDCIEVKFCWEYQFWMPALIGKDGTYTPAHWEFGWQCSEPEEVCPC